MVECGQIVGKDGGMSVKWSTESWLGKTKLHLIINFSNTVVIKQR